MKRITLFGMTIILIFLMFPIVSAGEFSLIIYPTDEKMVPNEYFEVHATHQLTPDFFEKLLPKLWVSQYTFIEVKNAPEWLSVSIPNSAPLTPPNGMKYSMTIYTAVTEDAPMNTTGQVDLDISTGKFMRTMFPWFPGLGNEFDNDQSFQIQTGYWEIEEENQNEIEDKEGLNGEIIDSSNEGGINFCLTLFLVLVVIIALFVFLWVNQT
jgi:hypothetical protein